MKDDTQPGKIEVYKDLDAEKIDELADLCELWKKNREKGIKSNAIASVIKMICDDLTHPPVFICPDKDKAVELIKERNEMNNQEVDKNAIVCQKCFLNEAIMQEDDGTYICGECYEI